MEVYEGVMVDSDWWKAGEDISIESLLYFQLPEYRYLHYTPAVRLQQYSAPMLWMDLSVKAGFKMDVLKSIVSAHLNSVLPSL